MLSNEETERFEREGFLVLPDFVTAEVCSRLRAFAEQSVEAWEPTGERTVITTEAMVVVDGQLPHWSDANRSGRSRHAYTVRCISASAEYPAWNWLQRRAELPLRRLGTVAA